MVSKAVARFQPIAPRKARLVADLVRNRTVKEALDILRFTPKKAARHIYKVVRSALANAQQEDPSYNEESLYVERIFVDEGGIRYWRRPRARGMAYRIRRRRCHITVILDSMEGEQP